MRVTSTQQSARILVVDDKPSVADLYATWLDADHAVDCAYGGREALELVDDQTDIVFLDRQMPDESGDQVLETIDERDLDCHAVMVTAVGPGLDIVEMPFDDYLTKPVTRDDLTGAVEEMLTRRSYDDQIQEYFSLVSKKATLESQKSAAELTDNEAYAELTRRVEALGEQVDETATELDSVEMLLTELGADE